MFTQKVQKTVCAAAIAAGLVLAPAAAHAVEQYPPSDRSIISAPSVSYAPGGTVTIGFAAGTFVPQQRVSFSLFGNFASSGTLAVVPAVPQTLSLGKNAAADGSLTAGLTLPKNASGAYNLTLSSGDWTRTWSFTVNPASAGSTTASVVAGSGNQLAETGAANDGSLLLWAAGGGIALVAGGIVVSNSLRKDKKLAS